MMKFKKTIGKIFNVLSYLLIIILMLYVLFMLYNKFVKKNNLMSVGNYYVFKIGSGSMEPTIHVYDYIIVHKEKDYKIDDVVTVDMNGYFVTHRIKEINKNEITTQGDANNSKDAPVNKSQIVGKYLLTSKILTFALNRYYITISIVIFIVLIEIILSVTDKVFDKQLQEENNKK